MTKMHVRNGRSNESLCHRKGVPMFEAKRGVPIKRQTSLSLDELCKHCVRAHDEPTRVLNIVFPDLPAVAGAIDWYGDGENDQ